MWAEPDLREIRAFLALAEELHFARTAERLCVTHSRVSQMIRSLEVKIGGRLFDRTSRRVRLTPTGEQLLNEIARPYQELQDVLIRAREAATGVTGTLRIGMYTRLNCGPHWLEIAQTFKARHPECDVELLDTKFDHNALDFLRSGEIDMLATRLPVSDDDVTVGPVLSHEQRVLLVARQDALAARASVEVEDFADRALPDAVGMPREMMDTFVPPVTQSGRRLRRINLRSFDEVLMRVASGEVVHPTVSSFLSHYVHDGVAAVPIRGLPPGETALVWLTANRSPKVAAFARAAADLLEQSDLAAYQPPRTPPKRSSAGIRPLDTLAAGSASAGRSGAA